MKPAIKRATTDNTAPHGWFIDGDYTGADILAVLTDLRFGPSSGYQTIHLDRDARDWLVRTLRRQ